MGRLPGFDYARPLFYMVTLKRRPGLADFSRLCGEENPPKDARGRPRYLIANRLTSALAQAIRSFGRDRPGLAPVETFIVMPDHIHLLLRLQGSDPRIPLGDHVAALVAALRPPGIRRRRLRGMRIEVLPSSSPTGTTGS